MSNDYFDIGQTLIDVVDNIHVVGRGKSITDDELFFPHGKPIGWNKGRVCFGLQMRYWPTLTMPIDYEDTVKKARGIPKNYFRCYIDQTEPKNLEQAKIINAMNVMVTIPDNPLYFCIVNGGNGTGKTFLGAGFVNTLTRLSTAIDRNTGKQYDWNPYFVNEADLLSKITRYNNQGMDWFWELTENCKMLVIDEFGMSQWSQLEKRRLEQLLFKRHGNGFRTVILTNRSQSELNEVLSTTIKSRFIEKGKTFPMTGRDLRGTMSESDIGKYWNESAERDDPF